MNRITIKREVKGISALKRSALICASLLVLAVIIPSTYTSGILHNAAASGGGLQIQTDRIVLPNPTVGGQVKLKLTITDQGLNRNPSGIDTVLLGPSSPSSTNNLQVSIRKADGSILYGSIGGLTAFAGGSTPILIPQNFTETGVNTGNFSFEYTLDGSGFASTSDLNNARLNFTYSDQSGHSVSILVKIRSFDGIVTASKSAVRNGDFVTIRVKDPDLNRDSTVAENASVTLITANDYVSLPVVITNMKETGANTGVFTKTIQIGADVKISDLYSNRFATLLEIHYTDQLARDLSVNVDRELNLKVLTATGSISVSPGVANPTSTFLIMVNDTDLNSDPTAVDMTSPTNLYMSITSNATNAVSLFYGIQGVETGKNTGIFNTTLHLSRASSRATSGMFSGYGSSIYGTALQGDVLTITYYDQKNSTGQSSETKLFIPVSSVLSTSPPTLQIVNHIIGGPATAKNFSLTVNGNRFVNNSRISVTPGESQVINMNFLPASLWNLYYTTYSPVCNSDNEVFFGKVVPGAHLKCDITNTFIQYNDSSLIHTDRAYIPIPEYSYLTSTQASVKFDITIRDNGLNNNPGARDSVILGPSSPSDKNNLQFSATDANGLPLAGSIGGLTSSGNNLLPQVFNETGPNTGIFTFKYALDSTGSATDSSLNGATLRFTYTAANGTSFSASVKLRAYDGLIFASKSSVGPGDFLTVTLKDQDLNLDNTAVENASVIVQTNPPVYVYGKLLTFTETGRDTGVFTWTGQVGTDVLIRYPEYNINATSLQFSYNDVLDSRLEVNVQRELDVPIVYPNTSS